MKKDNGGSAFPTNSEFTDEFSVRDYFAAKAMQSYVVGGASGNIYPPESIATLSYVVADAMLLERNK